MLDAAVALWAEDRQASMEAIAAAAGCGKATAYEIFPSREAMLAAVVAVEAAALRQHIDDARQNAEPGIAGVRTRVAALFLYARSRPNGFTLLARMAIDGDPEFRRRFEGVRGEVAEHLSRDLGPVATRLVLGVLRAAALGLLESQHTDDAALIDQTTAFIVGGLDAFNRVSDTDPASRQLGKASTKSRPRKQEP